MENNENKKTPEELTDEALNAVTGGGRKVDASMPVCPGYHRSKKLATYHDPEDPNKCETICAGCAFLLGYVL